jgi:positive regulator of sigma E activity
VKEKAVVIEVREKETLVRTVPDEKCSGCCSCGASRSRSFIVGNGGACKFSEGDILEIEVQAGSMLRVYTLFYALPLAVFIAVLFLVYGLLQEPVLSFVSACSVLLAVYFFVGIIVKRKPSMLPSAQVKKRPAERV